MGLLIGLLVGAAWLWFVIVLFTHRHYYNWKEMLLWVALEGFISAGVVLLFMKNLDDPAVYASAVTVAVALRAIYLFLVLTFRFQIDGANRKLSIIGVYIGVRLFVTLLMRYLGGNSPTL